MARPADPLVLYRKKRRFDETPEPSPEVKPRGRKRAQAAARFMIHKHDATRLHYDLRLEAHGALVSWAIPKGPSYDPTQKRLAVRTEDHPLAYGDFEGRIPDGHYGAGDSIVWEDGTYDTEPPGQVEAQLEKGHLEIVLEGQKLKGKWHLVRTRPLKGQGAMAPLQGQGRHRARGLRRGDGAARVGEDRHAGDARPHAQGRGARGRDEAGASSRRSVDATGRDGRADAGHALHRERRGRQPVSLRGEVRRLPGAGRTAGRSGRPDEPRAAGLQRALPGSGDRAARAQGEASRPGWRGGVLRCEGRLPLRAAAAGAAHRVRRLRSSAAGR